jgi:hypothetical protein
MLEYFLQSLRAIAVSVSHSAQIKLHYCSTEVSVFLLFEFTVFSKLKCKEYTTKVSDTNERAQMAQCEGSGKESTHS